MKCSFLIFIKEIKTNHIIGEKITSTKLAPIIDRGKKKSIIAYLNFLDSQLISQIIFYILITFLLIKASPVFGIKLDIIIGFIFVLLYLLGPIVNVITSIPIISRGLISYNILKDIRQELNAENVNYISLEEEQPKFNFKSLEFKGYHF